MINPQKTRPKADEELTLKSLILIFVSEHNTLTNVFIIYNLQYLFNLLIDLSDEQLTFWLSFQMNKRAMMWPSLEDLGTPRLNL